MDLKQLLEKLDQFAGQAVGQKPGDQVRGTEIAKPTKSGQDHPFKGRLVGGGAQESVLKDLSKGPKPKTKEQELAEQFEQFLQALEEDNLGVEEKRPLRKGSRPARDYGKTGEQSKRYTTVKEHGDPWEVDQDGNPVGWKAQEAEADSKAMSAHAKKYPKGDPKVKPLKAKAATKIAQDVLGKSFGSSEYKWEITFKDGKRAVYHHNSPYYKDATAASDIQYTLKSNPGATVKAYKDGEPFDWQALLNEGAADRVYTVDITRSRGMSPSTTRSKSGTLAELIEYFGYTLEVGKSYEHERGRYKINMNPKNIQSLVDNLNKAQSNAAANGMPSTYYDIGGEPEDLEEVSDETKMSYMTKAALGKFGAEVGMRKKQQDWDKSIIKKHFTKRPEFTDAEKRKLANREKGVTRATQKYPTKDLIDLKGILGEAWGMGPRSYKGWTYDVWEDDDGDVRKKFHSAKKGGQEVDMDWSPYNTPEQKDWELWIDLGMPTREQLGLRGPISSEDLLALAQTKQGTHSLLMKEERKAKLIEKAKELGIDESRAHKVLDTWFKNRELAQKYASGEVKIPTPQERHAELEKSKEKKQVKEYGANTSTASMGAPGGAQQQQQGGVPDVSKLNPQQKQQLALQLDPQAMKKAAAATSQIKSATGSQASGPNLLKALNAASQGKSVSGQDMTALKPMMDVIKKAATDPKLATQFKSLASQAKQMK